MSTSRHLGPPAAPHAPAPSRRPDQDPAASRLLPWLVAAVAVLAYAPAVRNGFAYDDVVIVAKNARIHHWATLPEALSIAYWYTTGQLYRPLTTLAFGVQWLLTGGSPAAFHVVSALLHALVSALVARVALRWWTPTAALAAGLLFAVHPVHVEAVANVVGQSELLCAAALVALVLVAGAPVTGEAPDRHRPLSPRAVGVALLSAAAVASKETGAVAPVLVWAAAWLAAGDVQNRKSAQDAGGAAAPSTGRPDGQSVRRLAAASVTGVAVMLALRVIVLGALAGDKPHPAFHETSAIQALLLALATLPRAVALVLGPQAPAPDYSPTDYQVAHPSIVLAAGGAALVAVAVVALVRHATRPSRWTLVVLLSAATLAPVSNLFVHTGVILAERTLYSPSIGGAIAIGAALSAVIAAVRARMSAPRLAGLATRSVTALACALIAGMVVPTERAIPMWHDTPSVIAAMQARDPESYRGPALRARTLREAGDYSAAQESYARALALFSADPTVLHDAGANALVVGDTASAIRWLSRGLAVDSTHLQIRTALVQLYVHRGQPDTARALLLTGLRIDPDQRSWRATLMALPSSTSGAPPTDGAALTIKQHAAG